MVVYYQEAECRAKELLYYLNVKVTVRADISKYDYFYYSFKLLRSGELQMQKLKSHLVRTQS